MNILILGSGGREHAFAWKIRQSSKVKNLFVAPGNAGTADIAQNIDLDPNDFSKVKDVCLGNDINMVVVGPEEPLVRGIEDYFSNDNELCNITLIGPSKEGAQLEGSKDFSKAFMERNNIPTAKYFTVQSSNLQEGIKFLETMQAPYVLKADGLAAGKGVLIIDNFDEAKDELKNMLDGKFGEASQKVVIEQFLSGIELSVFVLTDGNSYKILPEAKDYKRIGEGDTGLNTGGMGAISPVPFADATFMDKVRSKIVEPTVNGIKSEGIKYRGFIFIGLIKVNDEPYVIEYNVRMGDPETEVVMPRIKSDLVEALEACGNGTLKDIRFENDPRTVSTVMMVAGGYPESYNKGDEITNIQVSDDTIAFHAGTKLKEGKVFTNGGRVIALSAYGSSLKDALEKSYKAANTVSFKDSYFRTDIGFDIL